LFAVPTSNPGDKWGGSLPPPLPTRRFAGEFYFSMLIFGETPDFINYCHEAQVGLVHNRSLNPNKDCAGDPGS